MADLTKRADGPGPMMRSMRKQRKLSLEYLSRAAGLSISHLSLAERGLKPVASRMLQAYADALNVREDVFLSDRSKNDALELSYFEKIAFAMTDAKLTDFAKPSKNKSIWTLPKIFEDYLDEKELATCLNRMTRVESLSEAPTLRVLWTAGTYDECDRNTVAGCLTCEAIPFFLERHGAVVHIWRQGYFEEEVLETTLKMTASTKRYSNALYKATAVLNTKIRELPTDFYSTGSSGGLICFAKRMSGEPQTGLYIRSAPSLSQFMEFTEAVSSQTVKMFADPVEFQAAYSLSESTPGARSMIQRFFLHSTRPMQHLSPDSDWGRRRKESKMSTQEINAIAQNRRGAINLFHHRLRTDKVRQVLSFSTLEEWAETGRRRGESGRIIIESKSDCAERLLNVRSLLQSQKNLDIAIVDREGEKYVPWGIEGKDVSWLVQGEHSCVFEITEPVDAGHSQYQFIIYEGGVARELQRVFDRTWNKIAGISTRGAALEAIKKLESIVRNRHN